MDFPPLPLPVPEVDTDDMFVLQSLKDLYNGGHYSEGRYYSDEKIYVLKGYGLTVSSPEGTLWVGRIDD